MNTTSTDASPVILWPHLIFALILLGILFASANLWIRAIVRRIQGQQVLPPPESRSVQRWGLIDLIFTFLVVVLLQWVGFSTGHWLGIGVPQDGEQPSNPIGVTWIHTVQAMAVGLVSLNIAQRYRIPAVDVGWSTAQMGRDVRLGFTTFVLIAPPLYLLMGLVTKLSGVQYNHPLLEMTEPNLFTLVAIFVMAVVVAPLTEEFGFRVLFQGFLESMAHGPFTPQLFVLGRPPEKTRIFEWLSTGAEPQLPRASADRSEGSQFAEYEAGDLAAIAVEAPPSDDQTSSLSAEDGSESTSSSSPMSEPSSTASVDWWPIAVSGIVFGLLHLGYGMSWIPLVFLGFVLGYLYRITNRIWAGLVVHACVNATSMVGFFLSLLSGKP